MTSAALVVKVVPYGEADAVVTLFTEGLGKIAALARGARRSVKRLTGVLDTIHTLSVGLDERPHGDLFTLAEASLLRPRCGVLGDLGRIEAAGTALRWVRAGSPPRTPEPAIWEEITAFLDRLDEPASGTPPEAYLVGTGLRLLRAFGYGLDWSACVRCGRVCEPGRAAHVDPGAGGLICRACGHGRGRLLEGSLRARLLAAAEGRDDSLLAGDLATARELVEAALAAHAGVSG